MNGYSSTDLANAFRTVRRNTVQVAEDIPDDKYDFAAAPGVMTVREMLAHIAFSPMIHEDMHGVRRLTTLKGYDFGAIRGRSDAESQKLRTKDELIAALKSEGEKLASWLESLTPAFLDETFSDMTEQNPRSRFDSLLGIKEHEMHHRAQLMLIQRIIGIVPHLTRRREEVIRQRQAAAKTTAAAN